MTPTNKANTENARLAFDEFKLFYESAEKVTERRLETNRWNYSICTAILLAIAAVLNWAISNPSFLLVAVLTIITLSGMALLFCTMWVGQIHSFKMLNNAKFDVLNKMAPNLSFSSSLSDNRISFSPFEKEWDALRKKSQALEEISSTNILALKSSNIEYLIPRAFRFLFGLIILVAIVVSLLNWGLIISPTTLHLTAPPVPMTPTP